MLITEKKLSKEVKPASTFRKVIRKSVEEDSLNLRVEEPKVRYLKLQPFRRESRTRFLYKSKPRIIPELRLCGVWLETAGFLPENYVSITVMNGLLIIRLTETVDTGINDNG